jgi:hypothetical protein
MAGSRSPILRSEVEFISPASNLLSFFQTHPDLVRREEWTDADGLKHDRFSLETYRPVTQAGFEGFEQLLNPAVAAAGPGVSWTEVAQSIRDSLLGEHWEQDGVPGGLADVQEGAESNLAKLEAVFYWIRDRLKYGVFESAHQAIGTSGRAEAIINSGLADCKDRSYLLLQVCRTLGLSWELVMTGAHPGGAIEELPADQFDHVLLRTNVDGAELFLDPTSRYCVFGSVPFWLQGTKALILDREGSIVRLPEDKPHRNLLVIKEILTRQEDGWLAGSFFILARGYSARIIDERWKAMSLVHDDRLVSSRQALDPIFPGIRIDRFDQLASTSDSDRFNAAGTEFRCQLTDLGDIATARISWAVPMLPLREWRAFTFASRFEFMFPVEIELEVRFSEAVADLVQSVSGLEDFAAEGLLVRGSRMSEGRDTVVRRHISVEKRIFEGDDLPVRIPGFLEAVERALDLTVALRRP